jgi:hypothetical protein
VLAFRAGLAAAVAVVLLAAGCSSTTSGASSTRPPAASTGGPSAPATPPATGSTSTSAGASPDPTSGPNPPFRCTPGFVTTLSGYPVASKVRHYPVPKLTPNARGLAGNEGVKALKSGELDVAYSRESTGLPHGPSRSMYSCFVKYVQQHGWAPDTEQNKVYRKDRKPNDPLLFSLYDSGNRYKGGNELTVRWFDSKANYGLGDLLSVVMEPNQHIPDLPPPPR